MKKIILLFIIGVVLLGFVGATETFTPIFCNDYEFTCCNEKTEVTSSHEVSDEAPWTCPSYAYKCYILSLSKDNINSYVGSQNCHMEGTVWHAWVCDDEKMNIKVMNPNDNVYIQDKTWGTMGDITATIEIKITRPELSFCGKSGCPVGVIVSGEDNCKFSPLNSLLYTSTSSLSGKVQTSSYTVPVSECVLAFQSGDRHICGYKEESCSSDSDCGGHTYGNKECNGRMLQTYGCVSYGSSISEKDRGPFDSGWGSDKSKPASSGSADFGERCSIKNAEQVQCCGDTDCGTDYFCDKTIFTCKENVQCSQSSDCGVSTQCDWTTNTIKTPLCDDGKCKFNEIKVDCCNDKNCQEGSYCSNENKCTLSSALKEISANSQNTTSITGRVIDGEGGSSSSGTIIFITIMTVILGIIGIYVYNRKKSYNSPAQLQPINDFGNCTYCRKPLKEGSTFCSSCGKEVKNKSGIACPKCGKINEKWRKFCIKCGSGLV